MKPAAEKMKEKIASKNFKTHRLKSLIMLLLNLKMNQINIKMLLIEQIFSTVRWRESLKNMSDFGVKNFIEIGPGKAITGMVKRTLKNVNCFSINSIDDIKNFKKMNLKDKKILITGATGGIGHSLVEKFKIYGSKIIASGTNEEKLIKLKKNYPNIKTEKFKLDEHDKIESFIDEIDKELDGIEILINNAGITLDNLSIRLTEENWKKVFDINLTSTFLMCKFAIKKMLKKNTEK